MTLDWTTHLSGPEKGYADFTVDAPRVSETQISALGFAVNEYLEGSVALKSKAKLSPGGLITMTVESDFNDTKLEVPQIHWHKAKGEGGSIDFSLSIERNHLHAKDIDIELGPFSNGQYPFHIEVEDLGSLVSAVKGRDIMKSGYLVLDGNSQGPLLTKPLQAKLHLNYFTVNEAPAISSVLNMASLTQIISTFKQTGLAFNSASGHLQLDGSRLSSEHVRLQGGSLGIVGSGWVDLKQQNLALKGVVVPLNKLNTLVGNIPLLGRVIVGKDGHGVMAVDYTVTGTLSDPVASIQTESLTPDILRNIMGDDDEGGDPKPR